MTNSRSFAVLPSLVVLAALLSCGGSSTGPGGGNVASIAITPSTATVSIGATTPFQATPKDASGKTMTGVTVFWNSEHTDIATVNSSGVVTGVALGSTRIAASAGGASATATVTVTDQPVASVAVTPASSNIRVGQTVTLTGTAYNAAGDVLTGRTISWSSSDESIATVDVNGVVTGTGAGGAVITGTAEGKQGTATVTVSAVPVARVQVQPAADTLVLGDSVQLTATAFDSAGNAITGRTATWSTSNGAVAIVTSDGLVYSRAAGTATITATIGGKSAAATITVILPPVASVTVTPADTSIIVGTTAQLVSTLKDAGGNVLTGRTVTWSSSNASIASVNTTGTVTGVVASTAAVTITATSEGKNGTATVTVNPLPVASVTVLPAAPVIFAGDSVQLAATAFDGGGKPIAGLSFAWASSNQAVATVSATGMVNSLTDGSSIISATTSGKSGTATVTVNPVPVARVSVAPTDTTVVLFSSVQFTATTYDKQGNVLSGRPVIWSTSNGAIVSVDSTGLAMTHLTGKAKIMAKSEKQSATANITVKLPLLGDRGTAQ